MVRVTHSPVLLVTLRSRRDVDRRGSARDGENPVAGPDEQRQCAEACPEEADGAPAPRAVDGGCGDRATPRADGEVDRVAADELAAGGWIDLDDQKLVGDADGLARQVEDD